MTSTESTSTDKIWEEQRKWNEERIQRRLHGEYERAARQLAEIVDEKSSSALRLAAIRVTGAKVTRPSFLSAICTPHLGSQTGTLHDVLERTKTVSNSLAAFDIFAACNAKLERSPSIFAKDEDVDLVLSVVEKPRFFLRTSTDIGNSEGSATGTAKIRNVFGGAEDLEANVAFGTKTRSSFQLKFSSPIPTNPDPLTKLELDVFTAEKDLSFFASCRERLGGLHARLLTISNFGRHEVAYEGVHRKIADLEPYASMSIRKESGDSVKSALNHTFIRDTRDDAFMATRGSFVKCFQEYAGLGGDASHLKSETEYSISRALPHGFSLSFALRAGLLYTLDNKPASISDRFQLGGPTSIRMFRPNSIGPKDNSDFVGGEMTWSAGVSALTPIPGVEQWPLKGHLWMNLGKLSPFNHSLSWSNNLGSLLSQPVSSLGIGLLYRHSIVRVEANVGVPISASSTDGFQKGFQFGIGISFL